MLNFHDENEFLLYHFTNGVNDIKLIRKSDKYIVEVRTNKGQYNREYFNTLNEAQSAIKAFVVIL